MGPTSVWEYYKFLYKRKVAIEGFTAFERLEEKYLLIKFSVI